jgi:hypothetical protein
MLGRIFPGPYRIPFGITIATQLYRCPGVSLRSNFSVYTRYDLICRTFYCRGKAYILRWKCGRSLARFFLPLVRLVCLFLRAIGLVSLYRVSGILYFEVGILQCASVEVINSDNISALFIVD